MARKGWKRPENAYQLQVDLLFFKEICVIYSKLLLNTVNYLTLLDIVYYMLEILIKAQKLPEIAENSYTLLKHNRKLFIA